MRQTLNTLASLLEAPDATDPAQLVDWSSLRYPYTAAIAARLAETYATACSSMVYGVPKWWRSIWTIIIRRLGRWSSASGAGTR